MQTKPHCFIDKNMGIEVKYVRVTLKNINKLQKHPFGLDIQDLDKLFDFYQDLISQDYYFKSW